MLIAGLLAGCGGSTRSSACTPKARAAVARFLDVSSSSVSVTATSSNQAAPECDFRAPDKGGRKVALAVIIDSAPQPYFRLERTAEEAAQVFTPVRLVPAPEDIPGIGLDAYWYPGEQHLMTTDGVRLITATVDWPSAPQSRRVALATAAARQYLGPPRPGATDSP